jgi:hypothetical protein
MIFQHPPKVLHRGKDLHQDRSSSLRCRRCVLTPALTRCRLHGGRKSAKPQVANVLTQPHPFRDDKLTHISVLTHNRWISDGLERLAIQPRRTPYRPAIRSLMAARVHAKVRTGATPVPEQSTTGRWISEEHRRSERQVKDSDDTVLDVRTSTSHADRLVSMRSLAHDHCCATVCAPPVGADFRVLHGVAVVRL